MESHDTVSSTATSSSTVSTPKTSNAPLNPPSQPVSAENSSTDTALKQLFCGGFAGACAKTATAPLSRIAMLYQVHSLVSTKGKVNPSYASGILDAGKKIISREGYPAFWKGNGTSCLHRFPYSAINFYVYEKAFTTLGSISDSNDLEDASYWSAGRRFLAGASAGSCAVVACYPLDLIRTRLTTQQPATPQSYRGISHAFFSIIKKEGVFGLYEGLGTTLCVAVPSFSISYMIYGSLKEYVLDDERFSNFRKVDSNGHMSLRAMATLGIGAFAGALTALVTYPVDVTRRRLQIQSQYVDVSKRLGAMEHINRIIRIEGATGLYRGIAPELLKVVPFVGTMFGVYELLREHFNLRN